MVEIKKILLATDFSDNSKWAMTYALSFAQKYDAKLYILHVIQQPSYPLGMYAEISFDAMDKFNRNVSAVTEKEMQNLCAKELGDFKNYDNNYLIFFKNYNSAFKRLNVYGVTPRYEAIILFEILVSTLGW